jgi:hypothetical protein
MRRGSGTYVAKSVSRPRSSSAGSRVRVPYARLNEFWLQPEVRQALGFWRIAGDDAAATRRGEVDLRAAVVAVEDPGYPPMRVAFAAAGARLVSIPVDAEGLIVAPVQAGVAAFINDGYLTRHVRRMRHIYSRRRTHLVARTPRRSPIPWRATT